MNGKTNTRSNTSIVAIILFVFYWYYFQEIQINWPSHKPEAKLSQTEKPYPVKSSKEQNKPLVNKNPVVVSPEEKQAKEWQSLGKIEEKKQNLPAAIKFYTLAQQYWFQPSLEKKLQILRQQYQQQEQKRFQRLAWQRQAITAEKQQNWSEALRWYNKLPPSSEITKKKKRVTLIQRMEKLWQKQIQKPRSKSWKKLWHFYRNLETIYQKWPKEKQTSKYLQIQITEVRQNLGKLQQHITHLKKLLANNRIGVAWKYVEKIQDFPTQHPKSQIIKIIKKTMVRIPSGYFIMGSREKDESPIQEKFLEEYYIDRYEVSNSDYLRFLIQTNANLPSGWKGQETAQKHPKKPVGGVSWQEATDYAHWIGKDLPTEAEWEKAARGPNGFIYPWGNQYQKGKCNDQSFGQKQSVAIDFPMSGESPYGCFHMSGNVMEWTKDYYTPYSNTRSNSYGVRKVARGGSWLYQGQSLRASNRFPTTEDSRLDSIGFRCVLKITSIPDDNS